MTIDEAVNLLTVKHLENKVKKWIRDPVAYTLYEVWQIADSKEVYSPSYATVQPTTQADRIRAMSDEELVLAIRMVANCDLCPIKNCKERHYSSPDNCERHWFQWLQSPAEGGDRNDM